MPTNKNISNLIINKVESQAVYDYMKNNNLLNDDELYLVNDSGTIDASTITGLDTYLSNNGYDKIATGTYTGSGLGTFRTISALQSGGHTITFPFTPSCVIIHASTHAFNTVVNSTYTSPSWITTAFDIIYSGENKVYSASSYGLYDYVAYLTGNKLYTGIHTDGNTTTRFGFDVSGCSYRWIAIG